MATLTVQQSGGDYSSLNAALAAAGANDTISIQGTWTADDTTAATVSDSGLTITTDSSSRHPGYWDETQNHYRLVQSGYAHALTLTGNKSLTLDGVAIEQASTTTLGDSDECFRCIPNATYTVTIKNCLFYVTGGRVDQDGLYTGYNTSIGTVTVENCVFIGAQRAGLNMQNGNTATPSGTVNVNSCTFYLNGRDSTPGTAPHVGGGIVALSNGPTSNYSSWTINVHNTIAVENDTGGTATESPQDYKWNNVSGSSSNPPTWNVSYSIDSDGSIATDTDGGTGNLASRTATDSTSPGTGDWVVFEDVTSAPYDLRIVDNAENDAQDAHTTATAHGLTIPSTDIVGTSRPQNTNHDIGAFEIVAAGATYTLTCTAGSYTVTGQNPTLTASRVLSLNAGSYTVTGQDPTLSFTRLLAADAGSYTVTGQDPTLSISRVLGLDAGSYTVSGQDPTLSFTRLLAADAGSYTVTGQDPSLLVNRLIDLGVGSYTVSGQDVSLLVNRLLSATTGSYTMTGLDATLTYTPGGATYTLTCDAGSYTMTGQDASLLVSRILTLEAGVYTVTGQDAQLLKNYLLTADAGSYTVTGQDAGLVVSRVLGLDAGSYTVTGINITLVYSGEVLYVVAGDADIRMTATNDVGLFTTTSGDADIRVTATADMEV